MKKGFENIVEFKILFCSDRKLEQQPSNKYITHALFSFKFDKFSLKDFSQHF